MACASGPSSLLLWSVFFLKQDSPVKIESDIMVVEQIVLVPLVDGFRSCRRRDACVWIKMFVEHGDTARQPRPLTPRRSKSELKGGESRLCDFFAEFLGLSVQVSALLICTVGGRMLHPLQPFRKGVEPFAARYRELITNYGLLTMSQSPFIVIAWSLGRFGLEYLCFGSSNLRYGQSLKGCVTGQSVHAVSCNDSLRKAYGRSQMGKEELRC